MSLPFVESFGGQAALSAVSSVGGGLGNALFGGIAARRQWKYDQKRMKLQQKYNEKNMEIQNQYAIDAFNRENSYNDPRNVAARYAAAGINPVDALGGGSSGAGISAQMQTPDSQGPSGSGNYGGGGGAMPPLDLAGAATAAAQLRMQEKLNDSIVNKNNAEAEDIRGETDPARKDMELKDSMISSNEAIAALKWSEKDLVDVKKYRESIDATVAAATMGDRITMSGEQVNNVVAQGRILRAKADQEEYKSTNIKEIVDSEVNKNNAAAFQFWQQGHLAEAQKALTEAKEKVAKKTEKEVDERIKAIEAHARKIGAEADWQRYVTDMKKQGKDPRTILEKFEAGVNMLEKVTGSFGNVTDGFKDLSDIGLDWFGAIVTGGASAAVRPSVRGIRESRNPHRGYRTPSYSDYEDEIIDTVGSTLGD